MAKRTVTNYSIEFKQSSAKFAVESAQSVSQVARELGVRGSTLHGWIQKYAATEQAQSSEDTVLQQELKQLQKENARLKQERDILKKAAAYFASETP